MSNLHVKEVGRVGVEPTYEYLIRVSDATGLPYAPLEGEGKEKERKKNPPPPHPVRKPQTGQSCDLLATNDTRR